MFSAFVSLIAVFVSLIAVWISRLNQSDTLETNREIARVSREADYRRSQIDSLRDEVSQFCLLAHDLGVRFANEPRQIAFPTNEEDREIQYKVEDIYHKLLLRLDPNDSLQADLLDKIKILRDNKRLAGWTDDRDQVIKSARALFIHLWNTAENRRELYHGA